MVLARSHILLVTSGAVIGGIFASSHLLLVTNGAVIVIGGACKFTSAVSN